MQTQLDWIKGASKLNFSVYSKTKFDETMEDGELIDQVQRRFKNSLPLHHIDLVLV